jgi:hypothetical protein
MEKIKAFNKVTVNQSRTAIEKALASLKETHGISVSLGTISYDGKSFTTKLTAATLGDGGKVKTEYELNWESGCHFKFGLASGDLGMNVMVYGERFKIVGCKSRRGKRGVIGRGTDGRLYNLDNTQVKRSIDSGSV